MHTAVQAADECCDYQTGIVNKQTFLQSSCKVLMTVFVGSAGQETSHVQNKLYSLYFIPTVILLVVCANNCY